MSQEVKAVQLFKVLCMFKLIFRDKSACYSFIVNDNNSNSAESEENMKQQTINFLHAPYEERELRTKQVRNCSSITYFLLLPVFLFFLLSPLYTLFSSCLDSSKWILSEAALPFWISSIFIIAKFSKCLLIFQINSFFLHFFLLFDIVD